MRIFIAIPVPEEIEEELKRVQSTFYLRNVKLKYVNHYHLTLKFLGELSEENIPKIIEVLEKIKVSQFKLTLDNLSGFPNKRNVKVIWVGLKGDNKLEKLEKDLSQGLESLGIASEHEVKGFHPHITLARVKFIDNKKKFEEMLNQIKLKDLSFTATEFVLYKSTLTREGPVYEVVKKFVLEK